MKQAKYFILTIVAVLNLLSLKADNGSFKKTYEEAEAFLGTDNYASALPLYLQLIAEQPDNANLAFKVGICYLNSALEKEKAITYLEKAVVKTTAKYDEANYKEKNAPFMAWKYYGAALQRTYKFDEAISALEKYKAMINPSDAAQIQEITDLLAMSNYAKQQVSAPVNMTITNLGERINSSYADYAPVISADEATIIFTSRRKGSTGEKLTEDGKYFEDIFIAQKNDGEWGVPAGIGSSINTVDHEATIALSVDGQELYIYKDDNGDGNIYMSKLEGDMWTAPTKLGSDINSKSWEPSASLSADKTTLYFVSDRKGGFGGRDIYMSNRLPNGDWGLARNLGPTINTAKDEDSPFIHPDGTRFYFSSNGHKTMGGFDILVSTLSDEGQWQQPENLGYPINTTDDDVFYIPTASGKGAYYSSFREGGLGEKDIYYMSVPEEKETELTVYSGTITDHYGRVPEGLAITVTDNETGEIVGTYFPNTKTGKYLFILPPGKNYNISYEAEGYLFQSENIDVKEGTSYNVINKAIELADMKVGQKVVLKNIFFESGRSTLKPESKVELEKLKQILTKNNKLVIEISGHTDSQGADDFNQRLSEERAQSVKKHLVESGIEENRIKAVGYGETQPIAINTNPDGTENKKGMALNRRFEFKILSVDGNINVIEEIPVPEKLKPKKK